MKSLKSFNEDWQKKDDKKVIGKEDRNFVACDSEEWEKEPVFKKMKEKKSSLTNDELKKAFSECCKETKAPHSRDEFEECMIKKLDL